MEIREYYEGCRVHFKDEPESTGEIVCLNSVRARVSWDNGNATWERVSDLMPILTPKQEVGKMVPYWCKEATPADLAAVRSLVKDAIADCGLDATAEVYVEKGDGCVTLGHNPIKAVIKLHGTYQAVRMRNGSVVKGMDTISVEFRREGGIYNLDKFPDMWEILSGNRRNLSRADALAAGDAVAWEGESVEFKATTNGHVRGYRKRQWYLYEGGVPGYGANHIGGHYGYAESWESLKPDFAAYVRAVAHDLGYEGKVLRREVA